MIQRNAAPYEFAFAPVSHLLAEQADVLAHLAELVDATPQLFADVYQPALEKGAEFLQRLPCTDGPSQSLLASRLQLAVSALARRRAHLLPPGATVEQIARDADVWTYAVFSVTLLRGLSHAIDRVEVLLLQENDAHDAIWQPWLGGLGQSNARRFRVLAVTEPAGADWTPLLVPHLMPTAGLAWLWRRPALFATWAQALSITGPATFLTDLLPKEAAA